MRDACEAEGPVRPRTRGTDARAAQSLISVGRHAGQARAGAAQLLDVVARVSELGCAEVHNDITDALQHVQS
eukprot:3668129-Alexandrium_andersonii.AAC.1